MLSLHQSNEPYRVIFAKNPVPMFIFDTNTLHFLAVNEAAINFYGYSEAEFMNMIITDLRPIEYMSDFFIVLSESTKFNYYINVAKHRLKNGNLIDVELTSNHINWLEQKAKLVLVKNLSESHKSDIVLQNLVAATSSVTGEDFFRVLVRNLVLTLNVSYAVVSEKIDNNLRTLAVWASDNFSDNFSYKLENIPCDLTIKNLIYSCESGLNAKFPPMENLLHIKADSYLGIALLDSQGEPMGNLCILDEKPLLNIDYYQRILQLFATRAAAELERKRTLNQLQNLAQELEIRVESRTIALNNTIARLQQEINERKEIEINLKKALQELERQKFALDQAAIVAISDADDVITYVNDNFCYISQYSPRELIGKTHFIVNSGFHKKEFFADLWQTISSGKVWQGEIKNKSKDGSYYWVNTTIVPFMDDEGKPFQYLSIRFDITHRKFAEEQIKKSLTEKEVLIKEIHHRVKNNLQIISSLLKLQSRYITDDKSLQLLRESQNRVKAMALIHEKLYQSHDLSHINLPEYIHTITTNLLYSYQGDINAVKINMKIADIELSLDMAIPCGLLINELVSNSLQHGFPTNQKGEIWIILQPLPNEKFLLIIKDNGVGIPEEINFPNSDSLGLRLISSLVNQLDGSVMLEKNKGTSFTITFPEVK